MDLGKIIKLLRTSAGLKQEELAERLHVSSNYISLIENNKREPSLSFLRELANELGVPLGLLFLEIDKAKFADAPERNELLMRLRDLLFDIERIRLQQQKMMQDDEQLSEH